MNYLQLRQATPQKTFFLTKDGLDALKQRLDTLLEERSALYKRLHAMDTTERLESNFSAHEVKTLELTETEVTKINDILQHAEPISQTDTTVVRVGSTVTLDNGTELLCYTLVCPLEIDPLEGKISEESVLGRALLGKALHDEVRIKTPKGQEQSYKILRVS